MDLTNELFNEVEQHSTNWHKLTPTRSSSFTSTSISKTPDLLSREISPSVNMNTYQQPFIVNNRERYNNPSTSTTTKIYSMPQPNCRFQRLGQTNINTQKLWSSSLSTTTTTMATEHGRTFVHHSNSRPFVLSAAIQMKPINDILLSNEKRRPCHRQNALRYKSNEHERKSRVSTPMVIKHDSTTNVSRYRSIERRQASSPQSIKSFSSDINNELHSSDLSCSVRERAKLFERRNQHTLSTGRENYV